MKHARKSKDPGRGDGLRPSALLFSFFAACSSVVSLTDSNGTLVSTYQYDPSGNLTSTTGLVDNPWRYVSGYLDSSTGLYKFGARYYDPTIGRWTQQDPVAVPLGDLTSLDRYVYAGDDPVNMVDPSGLGSITITAACLGAIAAVLIGSIVGFYVLGKVLGLAAKLLITLGPVGWIFAAILYLVVGAALALGLEYLYNTVIAPACGWPQLPWLFKSITINF